MAMKEAETRSIEILENITAGLDFTIPDVDFDDDIYNIPQEIIDALRTPPDKLTPGLLTERKVDGNGMFDQLMTAFKVHIMEEYDSGRITGAEYTKAYIALSQAALQYAVQYLLGRDQAYYGALSALLQGFVTGINANIAKVQLAIAQAQAHQHKAQYAGTVLALAVNDAQRDLVGEQTKHAIAQTALVEEQQEQVHAQTSDTKKDGSTSVTGIMGGNINLLKQQKILTQEQTEQTHAQTSDKRMDGTTPVSGYTGNQNSLLKMQVQAFKNDAVLKGAKVFADSFATQASMGTATVAGTGLDAAGVNSAITKLQASITKNSQ